MTIYRWPGFDMVHYADTGLTVTWYPGAMASGCEPVPDDKIHATALGITPGQHRLVHELGHHLIGLHYYQDPNGSPIVYRDAHGIPQEAGGMVKPDWSEADKEEWLVNGLVYLAYEKPHDVWAVKELEAKAGSAWALARRLRWLMDAAAEGVREVVLPGLEQQKAA